MARMKRRVKFATALTGGFVVVALGTTALIPIGGAVVASGQVNVMSRVKRVAHPRGGVVQRIFVEDGQHVEKGQVLARLDDTVSGATSRLSGLTVTQLLAQRARLQAEAAGAASVAWPAALDGRSDPDAAAAMAGEQALFASHRAEAQAQRAAILAQIDQYHAELAGFSAQRDSARAQRTLIQPERDGLDTLFRKGLVSVTRRNQIERTAMELDGSVGTLAGNIAATRGRIAEARAQLAKDSATRRADAGTQLAALNASLNEQEITRTSAVDQRDAAAVRAPWSGTVSHLLVSAVGELVPANEVIAEIVPDRDRFEVEAVIAPEDVDRVRPGRPAHVRFSAFSRTATPEVTGTVSFVGPNRTNSPDGKSSYYLARIAIDARQLAATPSIRLRAGMPAEVYVETGSRSMLSYVLKPLSDQFARALRD